MVMSRDDPSWSLGREVVVEVVVAGGEWGCRERYRRVVAAACYYFTSSVSTSYQSQYVALTLFVCLLICQCCGVWRESLCSLIGTVVMRV